MSSDVQSPVVSVPLTARVDPTVLSTVPTMVTGEELAEYLGVSAATIATLTDFGMPPADASPDPRYHLGDCFVWFRLFQFHGIHGVHGTGAERHVDYQHALLWSTYHEIALFPDMARDFAVVPLRHDHPRRLAQLRVACDGLPALPAEPDAESEPSPILDAPTHFLQ
jgi:hypothetical protein